MVNYISDLVGEDFRPKSKLPNISRPGVLDSTYTVSTFRGRYIEE